MGHHSPFAIRGWQFDLVLHGGRVQLEAHHDGETISRWLNPSDSLDEAAYTLLLTPTCCLV